MEQKQLLNCALELWRGQGDDLNAARTLANLSDANRMMGLYEEGVEQAEEASRVFERLDDPARQAECLASLALLLQYDKQLDAAEETALRAIDLLPEKSEQTTVYKCHCVLGVIYRSKGETEKVVRHYEIALGIASALNDADFLFWVHHDLADLFIKQGRFSDAQTHAKHARSFVVNNTLVPVYASLLQVELWCEQDMFGEARAEALVALDAVEKLGSAEYIKAVRRTLRKIDARASAYRW